MAASAVVTFPFVLLLFCVVQCQWLVPETCVAPDSFIQVSPGADVAIGAILKVHKRGEGVYGCGRPIREGIEMFEAMRWAVAILNQDDGEINGYPVTESFIPGIKIGLQVYDSCSHPDVATQHVTNLFPVLKSGSMTCRPENDSLLVGLIDVEEIERNELLADNLRQYMIPVIPVRLGSIVPAEQLARVLAEITHDLEWEKLAIIHSDDEASIHIAKQFGHIARNGKPCIVFTHSVPSKQSTDSKSFKKVFMTVTSRLENSTGVLIIGDGYPIQKLMQVMNEIPETTRRLQWLFSWIPPETELRNIINGTHIYGVSPYPSVVSQLEDYWNSRHTLTSAASLEDRWFLNYVMSSNNCHQSSSSVKLCSSQVQTPVSRLRQTSHSLTAIHAVFTFAHALRKSWETLCDSKPGVCTAFRQMSRQQFLAQFLDPLNFSHDVKYRSPPEMSGERISSNGEGEIAGMKLALTVYKMDSEQTVSFSQAVAYSANHAELVDENVKYIPSPCPREGCSDCVKVRQSRINEDSPSSQDIITIGKPEALIIPLLVPIHEKGNHPLECGSAINSQAIQDLESALWIVDKINNDQIFLPGIQLGVAIIDTCSSAVKTRERLSNFLTKHIEQWNGVSLDAALAVVVSASAEEVEAATSMLSPFNISVISARDTRLSEDKLGVDHYLFQIPQPLKVGVIATIDLLKYLGWSYVSFIYDNEPSNVIAAEAFKKLVAKNGICIAVGTMLEDGNAKDLIINLVKARESGARAVVTWLSESSTQMLLDEVRGSSIFAPGELIWIVNGEWSEKWNAIEGREDFASGALLLRPQRDSVEEFVSYYHKLKPKDNKRNPWFVDYWQQQMGCTDFRCSPLPYYQNPSIFDISQAVISVASGLARLRQHMCAPERGLCSKLLKHPQLRPAINQYIQYTVSSSPVDTEKMFSFTINGYGDKAFEIFLYRRSPTNIYNYKKVAVYHGGLTNVTKMITYDLEGHEIQFDMQRSECILNCKHCNNRLYDWLLLNSPDRLYIAATVNVHQSTNNPLKCGTLSSYGIQNVEAFLWALDQLNAHSTILPGVTIGGLLLDTCSSREKTARDVSNVFSQSLIPPSFDITTPSANQILGFVASHSSNVVHPVVDMTVPMNITTIAPTASDTTFNDLSQYPYLLRLSPPNNVLADGIVSVLRHFRWTYVSILYDEYYSDLYKTFINLIEKRGITIGINEKLKSLDNFEMEGIINRLQWKQKQGARIIILFLSSNQIDQLLTTAEQFSSFEQPIWFTPETIDVFYKHPQLSLGAISVRSSSSPVPGFRDYFVNLDIRNNSRNPWFKEYWETMYKCRGASCYDVNPENTRQGPFVQDHQVSGIINSVFAFGQGLEKIRQMICPSKIRGLCPQMSNLEKLRKPIIDSVHKLTYIGADNKVVRFRSHNYNPGSYDIYNFLQVGNNAQGFVTIGRFSEEEGLQMNASKGRGYDENKKQVSLYNINSVCNHTKDCPSVRTKPPLTMEIVPDGDSTFAIGAVLPIHQPGSTFFTCGQLNTKEIFQNLAALAFAVDRINSSSLPKVGLVAFDYCGRYQKAEEMLYSYYSTDGLKVQTHTKPKSVIATLTFSNEVAKRISPILEATNITQITIPAASEIKKDYEALPLISSSPSIFTQIQVLFDLLFSYKWRYVYVIYSNDDFGRISYKEFSLAANSYDVCVPASIGIDTSKTISEMSKIFQEQIKRTGVIVVLTENIEFLNNLVEASTYNTLLSNSQWIIIDGRSDGVTIPDKTIVVETVIDDIPDFRRYLASLSLGKHDPIPDQWFEEFWQNTFKCRLSHSKMVLTQYQTECSGEERVEVDKIIQAKFVSHTINSVQAVVRGLHRYMKEHCLWAGSSVGIDDCGIEARKQLAEEIQKEIEDNGGCLECDPARPVFRYQIYQMRNISAKMQLMKVGHWRNQKLTLRKEDIHTITDIFTDCPLNNGIFDDLNGSLDLQHSPYSNFKTLWGIILTALSVLGIVLVIICALYFLVSFPVTVGTTVLGYMILVGLLILYTVNFAFIVAPTESTCGIRRFTLGLAYSVIFSGLLVKVINMWRMMGYHGNRMLNDGTKLSSPAGLLVIAVGLVTIQIILTVAWLVLIPPKVGLYNDVWRCSPPSTSEEELVISLVYVMLLLSITILFSILTWKCQDNNRESRWILACCIFVAAVWIAWTILWTQLPLKYRDITTVIANLICSTSVMLLLYLRKVYLYSKLTRQARDQEMTASLQPSTYAPSLYGILQKNNLSTVLYGSQASLNGKMYGGGSHGKSAWFTDDAKSDSSGSVQVQATDLYPLDMYDGGSQFQPVYGSKHLVMVDDNIPFTR